MESAAVELRLQQLIHARSFAPAAASIIQSYGAELHGFLVHLMGSEADAAEVFSQTAEDLWRGLPSFGLRCSVRTWLYVLGRHAAGRFRRAPWQRAGHTGEDQLDAVVAEVRTRTQPWQRTDVKDRWRTLRESLDEDARTLLVLRLDRGLSWGEVALVTLGSEEPDPAALARETARLRKRFQLLKDELRTRAREAGLLDEQP